MYWLVLLDDYSASFGLMVVVITTCLAVTRVYGEKGQGRQVDMPQREQGVGPVLAVRQGKRRGGGGPGGGGPRYQWDPS